MTRDSGCIILANFWKTILCSLAVVFSVPVEAFRAMDGEPKKESVDHVDSRHGPSSAYGFKTTTLEKWSYIAYYIGNNGLSGFVYGTKSASPLGIAITLSCFPVPSFRPFTVSKSSCFGRRVRSQWNMHSSFFRAAANRCAIVKAIGIYAVTR